MVCYNNTEQTQLFGQARDPVDFGRGVRCDYDGRRRRSGRGLRREVRSPALRHRAQHPGERDRARLSRGVDPVPPGWAEPVFQLNHNYPA